MAITKSTKKKMKKVEVKQEKAVTVFTCSDGKEFEDKKLAEWHEQDLEQKGREKYFDEKIKISDVDDKEAAAIAGIWDTDERMDCYGDAFLFCCKTKKDVDLFRKYFHDDGGPLGCVDHDPEYWFHYKNKTHSGKEEIIPARCLLFIGLTNYDNRIAAIYDMEYVRSISNLVFEVAEEMKAKEVNNEYRL